MMGKERTGQGTGHRGARAARLRALRALPAALLVGVGLARLGDGAAFRRLSVLVPQEALLPPRLVSDAPSLLLSDQLGGGPAAPEPVLVDTELPEPAVTRDVTVGGIIRLATGELRRTYAGEAPDQCPTCVR